MTLATTYHGLIAPDHVPPEVELTAHEQEGLDALIAHFGHENYVLPLKEGSQEKAGLTDAEMMFLSRETLVRFYTGQTRNGTSGTPRGIKDTITRLETTLLWRRTEGLDDIAALSKCVDDPRANGTVMTLGFGTTGMPIVYFFPNRDSRPVDQRKVVGAFFMLDRALDLMNNGQNQAIVVFSFCGKREGALPTPGLTKDLIMGYAAHYPETLGRAIVLDMPWWARLIVNFVWPFVDAHTKSKVVFSGKEALANGEIDPSMLLEQCGGDYQFPDVPTYFSTLMSKSLDRREGHYKAWLDLGPPAVGREERLFKPSTTKSG